MNMNIFFGKIFVLALLLSAVLAAVEVFVTLTLHGIRLAGAGVAVVIRACPGECDLQLGGWDAASSGLLLARVRKAGVRQQLFLPPPASATMNPRNVDRLRRTPPATAQSGPYLPSTASPS